MSTKHIRNAGDLVRFKLALRIECLSCGHANELAAMDAFTLLGGIELRDLEPRLKCSECQRKCVRMTYRGQPQR